MYSFTLEGFDLKHFTKAADRGGAGCSIEQERVTYRGLTQRGYLRDMELKGKGGRRKRITLPPIVQMLDAGERRRKAQKFMMWKLLKDIEG